MEGHLVCIVLFSYFVQIMYILWLLTSWSKLLSNGRLSDMYCAFSYFVQIMYIQWLLTSWSNLLSNGRLSDMYCAFSYFCTNYVYSMVADFMVKAFI